MSARRIPNLGGSRAVILHRPHDVVDALRRQLTAIGLSAEQHWPDLPASVLTADFLFFDADMGFDEQFPWKPGEAPLPSIVLIGSEAPGRIEWSLSREADAQLLKPIGSGGVYSSLLIAQQGYEQKQMLQAKIAALRERISQRETIVRAISAIAGQGGDQEAGFTTLRNLAMDWQMTMEDAAKRVLVLAEKGTEWLNNRLRK
jgi:AmiR/NasT family two-component response regulator